MLYQSMFPPSRDKPKTHLGDIGSFMATRNMVLLNFNIATWLAVGAVVQSLAIVLFPKSKFILLGAAAAFLGVRLLDSLAVTCRLKSNPFLEDVVPHRTTALVPNNPTGTAFDDSLPGKKMCVFILRGKLNHPLGVASPGASKMTHYFKKMHTYLADSIGTDDAEAPDTRGFLGASPYQLVDGKGAVEIGSVSYWRSVEDVINFAEGDIHREGWAWLDGSYKDTKRRYTHLGFMHEIYEAPAGRYENVFVNYQPGGVAKTIFERIVDSKKRSMAGTGQSPLEQDGEQGRWISPVVDARGPVLTYARGRLETGAGAVGQKTDHSQ